MASRLASPLRPDERIGWRVAALSIVGFWVFYFAINTLKNWIVQAPDQLWMMERRAIVTIAGMGLSALLCLTLRHADRGSTGLLLATAFIASVPITIAYATINHVAFYYMVPEATPVEMAEKTVEHGSTASAILWAASSC